jgi:hypothetical protein
MSNDKTNITELADYFGFNTVKPVVSVKSIPNQNRKTFEQVEADLQRKLAALPTDKTVAEIQSRGLRLVHKPSNLISLRAEQEMRRMQICSSPEAA